MSTIVYQGMQSCIESQIIETTILKLKVSPITSTDNKCHIQGSIKTQEYNSLESFNSIQNLSTITPTPSQNQNNTYIHPSKKTSPMSQKSLELCTENLGSETGSDDGLDIDILSFNDVVQDSICDDLVSGDVEKNVTLKLESRISRKEYPRSFPPPLTSIRSSNSIQCRPHRENGRLIIEAIELPSRNTYLHAERSNGRLRLSFLNDCDEIESNNEGDFEDDDVIDCYDSEEEYEEEEEEEEGDNDVEVKNETIIEEEIIGKIGVEGEIGIEKFQRLSRCMEGRYANRNLCNWRNSLWVATS